MIYAWHSYCASRGGSIRLLENESVTNGWIFDWDTTVSHAVHLAVAYLLAVPIGWNREQSGTRSAGLRTFPLVSVGACAYVLVGIEALHDQNALSRIIYGIVTGIGFIGGGAILKHGSSVSGTATAAGIWNTGAIGIAVGWGRLDIAIILTVFNFLTLLGGRLVKDRFGMDHQDSDDEQ